MYGLVWTDEEDRWVNDNAMAYRRDIKGMVDDLNERFGKNRSVSSVRKRMHILCIRNTAYTEEQNEWLKSRFYVERKKLTDMFNKRFNETRSLRSIRNKMTNLECPRNRKRKEVE